MELIRRVTVLDAANVTEVSTFWAALLGGGVIDADERFHCVIDDQGRWVLGIQHAPDHQPPDWPHGNGQQLHLDLHVTDPEASIARAREIGARPLLNDDDPAADAGYHVFADPAGHPFCIGWGHPTHEQLADYLAKNPPKAP